MGNRRAGQVASGNGPACSRNEKNAARPRPQRGPDHDPVDDRCTDDHHAGYHRVWTSAKIPGEPASPDRPTPTDDSDAVTPAATALAVGGLLAFGLLAAVARLRRRQQRHRQPGRGRGCLWAPPPGPNSTCGPPPNPIP